MAEFAHVLASSPDVIGNCEYSEPPINDRLDFVLHEKEVCKVHLQMVGVLEHETHENVPIVFQQ